MVEPKITYVYAQILLALRRRLSCFVIVFLFWSTLNSGPYARAKHSTQSGTFVNFFNKLAPFITNLPFTVERYGCLCAVSFKPLMKKSDSPTSCVFAAVYPHCEQTFEEGISTNRIVHFRLPYTFRGSTLSEFFLSCLYQVFVDRLFVFVSPLKQN